MKEPPPEDRETRLSTLRRALVAGEHSGGSTSFSFDQLIASKRAARRMDVDSHFD